MGAVSTSPSESGVATCYRHPGNRAGVVCQRCDRPICTQCMHQASVGFHCPECVKGGAQRIVRGPQAFDPIVTKVLIGLNALAWLWSSAQSGSIQRIGGDALLDFGLFGGAALAGGPDPIGVANGEVHRLLTSGFLHDGIIHIGFNMYALWILGPQLERALDRPRFLALYVASLLGGAAGVMLLDPDSFTVGASGAVFGLFGAVAVIQRAAGANIWASGIGQVLALNLLLTFAIPRISVGGHLGGLVAGALVGALFIGAVRAGQKSMVATAGATVFAAALAVAAVALASNPLT